MKKIRFTDINDAQLIDVRSQTDYQAGHLKGSLNLNPGNYRKFARYYLNPNQPVVFLVNDEDDEQFKELSEISQALDIHTIAGYLVMKDIPEEECEKTATISAAEFLTKEDFILLDVRNPAEITRPAPEKNLVTIPFEALVSRKEELDKNKTIYTLCGSGNRGTAAASYLTNHGYSPVVIAGGIGAIQAELNN